MFRFNNFGKKLIKLEIKIIILDGKFIIKEEHTT